MTRTHYRSSAPEARSLASLSEHTGAKAKLGFQANGRPNAPNKFAQILTAILTTDEPTVRRNAAYQDPLDERNTSSRYRTTSLNFGRFSGAVMINAS